MKRIPTLIIVLLLTSMLLVGSCSSQAPQVGKTAPDFQLPNLDGESTSLSDLRGTPVFLNFWATWCGPCRLEMPFIQGLYEGGIDKPLVVLTINVGESSAAAQEFMESYGFSFPVLSDRRGEVAELYNVRGIPTTFFIDEKGIIQAIKVGAFSNMAEIQRNLSIITSS